jgi:hypothetical protein
LEAAEEISILVNNFYRSGTSFFQVFGRYDKAGAARAERLVAPTLLSSQGFFFFFFELVVLPLLPLIFASGR